MTAASPPPPPYKEVSESAYSMPRFKQLNQDDSCEIVEINGDNTKLKYKNFKTFSQGPFITVKFVSYGDTVSSSHGSTPRAIVTRDDNNEQMTQADIKGYASFFFVVKGGETAIFSGGRKSRRRKSNKNKRTRRKSVKRLHRRK